MSKIADSTRIGVNCASLDIGKAPKGITHVSLVDNSGNVVGEAALTSDTGRELTALYPNGNNTLAASILNKVKNYAPVPYTATSALIDPCAELGDGVTIGRSDDLVQSVLASEDITFDGLYTSDINETDTDEIDEEYPYVSPTQKAIEKVYSQAHSEITKSNEEIKLAVYGKDAQEWVSGKSYAVGDIVLYESVAYKCNTANSDTTWTAAHWDEINTVTELAVTLDGVTVTDSGGTTYIKGSSIQTTSITSDKISTSGINADKLNLTGEITWSDLDSSTQEEITDASSTASTAWSNVTALKNGTSSGGTFINGSAIYSPSIYGSTIYATSSDSNTYATMTSSGFQVYQTNAYSGEDSRKCFIGRNPNLSKANQSVILGSDTPLYVEKYYDGGHYGWIGNGGFSCGILFNFSNDTYSFYGTQV